LVDRHLHHHHHHHHLYFIRTLIFRNILLYKQQLLPETKK
jgi:hypothetical protein